MPRQTRTLSLSLHPVSRGPLNILSHLGSYCGVFKALFVPTASKCSLCTFGDVQGGVGGMPHPPRAPPTKFSPLPWPRALQRSGL